MSAIKLERVVKAYEGNRAVDQVTLEAAAGSILALLGSSGCGKTTTLRLIAGLETPDSGVIHLNGRIVSGAGQWVPPEERRVGMVFQDYALFPHLTAAENIAFALAKLPARERPARIQTMLDLVGLKEMGGRYPHQLSGGEQQRVALARALAANPAVVLLDEPFSNLDAALRKAMREEVRHILRRVGTTAVFVTHDQEEALSIADQIAVLRAGQVLQTGSPQAVYLRPASREVALFLGEGNFIPGRGQGQTVETVLGRLPLLEPAAGEVEVLLRPEAIQLQPDAAGSGRVTEVRFFGHDQMVRLRLADGTELQARTWARADLEAGMAVQVSVQGAVMAMANSVVVDGKADNY
jgi:iron(III) transport system ATP-binding protein